MVLLRYMIFLIGVMTASMSSAQTVNPFEIRSRLPKITLSSGTEVIVSNPFDVVPHRAPGASETLREAANTAGDDGKPFISLSEGQTLKPSFYLWVLMFATAFFVFSVAANRAALVKAWRSFLNDNALNVAQREAAGFVGSTPYFLMYGSFLLNAGIFIFLIIQAFNPTKVYFNWPVFWFCMAFAWAIFLSKHALLHVVRWLIPYAENEITRYNFLIIIFNCVLGFFLLPFNFLIAFAKSDGYQMFLTLWLLGLAGIFYLYRTFRALLVGIKILSAHQFHFFLYLCSAEIAPVLILIKLFR